MKRGYCLLFFTSVLATSLQAQGLFQNLGFESGSLPTIPTGQFGTYVSAPSALPAWTAYIGGAAQTQVLHNNQTLGISGIDVFGPNWDSSRIIEGNYSVLLQTQLTGAAAVGQTGTIPADAQTVQFKAWGTFSVSFKGQVLSPTALSSGANYVLYSADIASFKGQTGELLFVCPINPAHETSLLLDSVAFTSIPEPASYALFLLGLAALFGFQRFRANA